MFLQQKVNGRGSTGLFSLDAEIMGLVFVLKLNDNCWLNYMDRDFYIPLSSGSWLPDTERLKPLVELCSGTGSGYEILCQGFNWESHKSGKWYKELNEKAAELSSLGFTIIWLPPPTESVSPEGYMPKDLYNLNSR